MKRVTINDVAKRAEVSPTSVSFAFNKPEVLSERTVERILSAAQELGYAPSPVARAMSNRKLDVIGVLAPKLVSAIFGDPYYCEFLRGVGMACDKHNLDLLILSSMNGSIEDALSRAIVDGFVINAFNDSQAEIAFLRKRGVPHVIVDGSSEHAPTINIADESGSHQAAAHLLAKGHTDILTFAFDTDLKDDGDGFVGISETRLAGHRRAYAEAGVAWMPEAAVACDNSPDGGERAFLAALDEGRRPTAALAFSDAIARGIVAGAQKRGLRVPDDLEVIGFDDLALASVIRPTLSTVHQPILEKGARAVEAVIAAMKGNPAVEHVVLPTRLVLRETTR
jgi:DNA-binding LacI/PurR family transcriptional regulator